jgi:type II secretory pathway component GspD/PulD (secretin)
MSIMNAFPRAALLLAVTATPLLAQRGGTPPTRRDTAALRNTPDGFVLEFVDQDVATVLRAIAEAGGLSITLSNLPTARVSLRMSQQMTREAAIDALKAVAEGNEITVTEGASVIRLVGPPRVAAAPRLTPQQQALANQQNRVLNLYTVRLKHSTASTVAPMLMNLLTGTGSVGVGPRAVNTQLGGIQAIQQGRGGQATQGVAGGISISVPPQQNNPVQQRIEQAMAQALGVQVISGNASGMAFSDMRIVPDETTNSLIVRATAEDFQALQQLVQSVDLRPLQVVIEVTIAQVERSSDLGLGVSGSATRRAGDTAAILPGAGTARDFVYLLTGGRGSVNYELALNALQSRGNVKVLALPIIIAQNNRQAVLNVGSSVPFVQVTQAGGIDPNARVQTIQYLPVGKSLTITPTINTDGYVNMEVVQTNNDVSNNLLFDAPIINEREASTSVFVRDGQTTVIGGLSDNTSDETTSGIPFLSRLPLIGWLFGNTTRSNRTTELFLFLTPHIVSSDEDIDRLRESIRSSSDMLKGVRIEGRINMGGDTINVGVPDSTVRRRVPPSSNLFLHEPRF